MNDYSVSDDLERINATLQSLDNLTKEWNYGDYPKGKEAIEASREQFLRILKEISQCHNELISKISDDMSDDFVPSGSVFKLGIGKYIEGVKSLSNVVNLVDQKS